MTFLWVYHISDIRLAYLSQNMQILHKMSHFTPWGAYLRTYLLTQWYFLGIFNIHPFEYSFVMIIQDSKGQIDSFLSKYAYSAYDFCRFRGQIRIIYINICIFCLKHHFWPPGCLYVCMYPIEWWYFFKVQF